MPTKALPMAYESAFIGRCKHYPKNDIKIAWYITYADTTPLERDFGLKPSTPLREGLRKFTEWYARYYDERQG